MVAREAGVPLVSCWLCDAPTEVRFSKKDRPYLVCECGVQTFIRYSKAQDLLLKKVRRENSRGDE